MAKRVIYDHAARDKSPEAEGETKMYSELYKNPMTKENKNRLQQLTNAAWAAAGKYMWLTQNPWEDAEKNEAQAKAAGQACDKAHDELWEAAVEITRKTWPEVGKLMDLEEEGPGGPGFPEDWFDAFCAAEVSWRRLAPQENE